jgi:hypothetical protein
MLTTNQDSPERHRAMVRFWRRELVKRQDRLNVAYEELFAARKALAEHSAKARDSAKRPAIAPRGWTHVEGGAEQA